MTTKLIILIAIGFLIFGAVVCIIVKAWRYRRNHPDEVYWPYNGPLHKKKKSKTCHKTLLVATLILSTLMWTNGLMAQNGTREHPYPIGDISTLISFAQCINNNQPFAFKDGKFVFDIDGNIPAGGAGTYFEQTADIDMNSANWNIPIGKQNKGFEGTYLGGGHKIMNLTLTADNRALFCHSKGHISDLTIENPVFEGTFNDGGALATYVMGGTIDNCHVTGNDLVFNGKDCGALIGWVGQLSDYFKADSIRISNCSNRCHITSTYQQSNANDQNSVAGVVAVINARHYVVTRCFNTGDITSTYRPKFQNDELCFAGVVGRGLLPNYPSEITYCYNRGDITAHCGYLGGVAGFFNDEAGISNSTRCAIDYCFNTGNITGECVLNSDNPSVHTDADSSLNVFSLGGVVAPCKTPTRYCFNTGNVTLTKHPHPKFNIWGDQGVAGVGSNAEHCFNVGEINNYEERNGRAAGVARDTAAYCLNAACVYDRNPKYTFSPHNIARIITGSCYSDAQMSVDGQDGNLYPTSKIIGKSSSAKWTLGDDWIYEKGRYPRLKWTDTCDWARDIAKVACTPIILADTVTDIHHVKNDIQLTGCDSGVVWKAPEGNCLFVDPTLANTACSNNAIQPALQSSCGDFVTVAATLNGDTIKTVTLLRSVAMPHDTLTVDNLDDLKELRDGVNTGKAFPYKSYEVPRYADGVTFKLTTDLDMQSESPWAPIGSVFSGSRFAGHFLGGGHTIDNLSLDDATPYIYKNANVGGLFGMLSGEVHDLTFTNLHADSTTIVAGAVCALMNGATIENCIVKGHIETSRSSNNYAISGTAGLAGASLTTRDQDFNFFCSDTIRNCVNYADIITHVGRGANIASHSVGGIIGHGGVVIDCANAGDISGGSECGYIGGIGGDMTSALRCFNTGRVTIAEAPQAIDYFVGGVVGKNEYDSTIMYCYNAGTVDGSDRSPVGGIVGYGAPRYCYMTNTVTGRGKYLGSIAGTVNPNTLHCYYDKQMSPLGGENGQDASGRSLGLETTGMLGSALQSSLGDTANWIFTPGLYPQLAISADVETQHAASLRAQLSRVSVMPVVLGPGQNWMSAHDSIPLRGCDEHHFWTKLQGCVTVDSCHVTATDRDMGVIELAATIDSVPYRFVTLKFNMDEKHALVIKNAAQFDTMRMVINNGGYYNYSDSTFHTAIPANADSTDFVAIEDGGNERFFKLITDIDINDIKEEGHVRGWIPVGGFAGDCCTLYEGNPFKGTFDGGGHTIRHLTFQRYDNFHPTDFCDHHQGLFGTVDGGTVKNLRIAQSDTTLGNSSAFLCSVNKGGTLYHCEIDSCTLTIRYGASDADRHDHALLCAKNEGGTIDSCQVKNSEIAPDSSSEAFFYNIGGVCALNDRGVVSRCIAEHLSINDPRQEQGALQSVGGICGKNFHGQLQFGTIKNSQITLKMNLPHKFIGGICGLSGYDPVKDTDEQTYAHIPSVISDCNSDSTIINAYTHGDNDSTKSIMNIGGIVGSCQGRIIKLERCSTMENSRILAVADTVGGICGRFCGEGGESYCNTCGNNASVTGNDYVGGIVGLMSGAQMHEGNNQGEVRSLIDFEYNSGYYAGGIAGAVVGESSLFDCDNSGTVAADSSYVGGIAGALMGESNLFLCINHGDVSGFNQVGGLAGLILKDAWFEVSSNNGLVRGIAQVGGLVGYLKSSTGNRCSNSHNYADTIHFSAMGGGVCGYAEDTTMLEGCSSVMILPYDTIIRIQNGDDLRLIRDNVNNGSNNYEGIVIVLDWDLNLGNGWEPIGTPEHPFRGTFDGQDHTINFGIYNESNDYQGFFGYMQGTVKNVNFTQCSVIGRNYVGVIAGYCHGTISNCYSYREKVEGEKYVGGLVGMASYSEIQDCFNGNNIVGEQYVGGIVGDFASCKNDNCYGTMKYDLHGGNVSRCYNYGMVRATGDTSHVGGIAGFTSAEVKHCYNSGIVDGKDFVGGLCGQLDGDNLHHCYNAGHVSATGDYKGAVCGSLDLQNIIYNCFYDRQMCTVQDNNASGYNTLKMTGTALQNVFGTDYWSYHDNEYPTLKTTKKDSTYFRISVKPLLLPGNMPVDKIVQPFCGVTGNAPYSQVEWSRYGTATETVGTIHLADKDSITLLVCGVDTLKVSHPGYGFERLVPIVVAAKEATVETVHTCGSIYKWNKNNQYYNETGFYTCDTCANKPALDLTITPVTITSTLINSTCVTIPDGAVLVSVTGGPGNGFRYTWYNSSNDSIGNTPALTDIPADYYSVTVTDSLFPTCEQTSPQQLSSSDTVKLTIKSCDASKTYDGTALTGNRYVVTEEGFEPDTLPADSFAILANGDTLRVTFGNGLINVDTLENGAEFTYSISNGIDHSCHYNVDTIFGTLSITPRPATIIVNDTSKTYGDEDPVFSGTVKGLVNSDSLVIHYFRSSNIETVGNHPDILTAELNENYTVTIDSGDLTISCRDLLNKIDTANWPDDIENWNECYSPSNTNALPSIDSIKKLIIKQLILANNDTLQPDAFQVLTKDSTILANNCDWKWVRTYTVKISNPNFCDSTSRVIYVSGGDQTAPVHSNNYLWTDGTVYQDACLASFDIDLFFPKDQDLFDDCSQMTITHKDTNTGDDHYGWTIRRSYVVTDACGHTIYDTIEVSGRDQTPPVASNPEVKNNTLWADSAQCLCDSIRTIHDIEELTTIFGISDACSGEDVRLVSSSKTLKTGEHCDYTVIIAYVVADAYGNSTTIYHAQFIQDTIGPTFEIVPHDTTLCVDPDGNYENTVTRVAAEITITNLHDNCTSLQESFSVQSSMDTSRFDFHHPRGYRITQGESDNGVRHYKQLWTVTDSCGNTTYDSISIHVRPLPKITEINVPDQHIIYGNPITEVWIYHQYSDLSITGLSGIGLDSLGCSVEHKKDQNNNEYDRVYGDPEFAVNATFLVTANSHQGWGCSIDSSTFSIRVEPRPIVITATNATKKYDGTPLTSNNYTCTTNDNKPALVHEDVISRLSFSGSLTDVDSCENTPGNAKITAPNDTTIDKTSNYLIDYYPGKLTVTVNDTLIKVIPGSASKVYDGSPLTKNNHDDFTVTGVPESLTWTATADGTVTNVVPGVGEKAVNAVTSFHIFNAEGDTVTAYFTNIDTSATGTLTITPVSVLVNADAKSKVYGEADPPLTVTITGVLENDDFIPNYTISRETGDTVGQYIITPAGAIAQGNYTVKYDTALFTITPKAVSITVNDTAKTYGESDPAFTGTVSGLLNDNDLGTVSFVRTNTDQAVGIYENVLSATFTANNNYNVTIDSGNFTINCRNVTMKPDSVWPEDLTGQNNCFANADTTGLNDAQEIQKLFEHSEDVTVAITDIATKTDDCDWKWKRVYTITVTGGCAPVTDSMCVSGSDQTAPVLTGTWPANISGINSCIDDTLQNKLYTNAQVKALFSDCGEFTVDSTVTTTGNNCDWTVTKTYTVKDACGNIYYTSDTTLPSMSVSGSDQTAPMLTGTWPGNISNVNSCLNDTLQNMLYTNTQVKALFSDCGEFSVDSVVTTSGNNCNWTVTKTYTVKDACGNIYHTSGTTLPTMSVSGSDQTMPALTGNWPGNIENVNSCIADSLEFMLYTNEQVKALFHDFENITVDSTVTTTGNNCAWTVTKTYTVKDSCGNVYYTSDNTLPTMSVSGSDQTAPVLTGTWPGNISGINSCIDDTLQNKLYTNEQVKALFSDCGEFTVDSTVTTTGDNCSWIVTKTYTVKDACGNIYYTSGTTLPTMSVRGSDQTAPVLTGTWPGNISNVNSCLNDTLQNMLYTNTQVKALFSDCGEFSVDSVVTTSGNNCNWTVTKTYTVKDECGNIYYTSGNTLPTMSVSGSDQTAPVLTGLWPSNISNVNSCIADSLEFKLYTNAQVKALFSDCGEFTVDSSVTTTGDNCFWTVTKTYTVKDACGNIYHTSGTTLPTMSVSGSDQTMPALTGNWPGNIENVNSCIADSLEFMLYTNEQVKALFHDFENITVDSTVTTTGNNCAWTVTKTYTVKDSCGNVYYTSDNTLPTMCVSGSDQTAPVLTGSWPVNISNVNSCIADTLQNKLYTNAQVKALFSDCGEFTVDSTVTTTGNNCDWTVTKTYTVKDACGNIYYTSDTTLPSMSVSGSDQTAPVLTGSWPVNISNVNSCIADTLQNKLYTNAQVKALFSDCGNILVDSTVTLTGSNCSWTVTKTYTVKDECGNIYYTSGNTLPTMSVSGSDQTAPVLTGLWPSNISNVNSCIADSLEFKLYTNAQVKALFSDCGEFTVDSSVTTTGDNCFWTVTKTYTVKDACGNIYHTSGTTLPTMSVSGSDQTMPALTGNWPGNIENVNSCIADSLEFMLYTNEQVKALFHDFENITVDSTVTTTGNNCAWTVTKTYTVKDSCGNVYYTSDNTLPTMCVSGSDQTAPVLTGTWPANISGINSCIDDTLQNKLYTNAQVKALFSDCGEFTVDSVVTTTGDNCAWTVTKTYTVKDACGNIYYTSGTTLPTMSVSGNDQSAPVLTGTWPGNITNQNSCLANADISVLKDGAYIRSLYEDCSGIITVTFDDDTTGNDCAWTITRTYTVTNGYNHTTTPAPTMSVSGGDHTAPVLTGNWPNNITSQHNCLLNADLSGLKDESYIQALYEDCSGIVTVTFDDDTTGDDCAWSITRTYTVMDGCQNALVTAPTMSVSGGDYSKPSFTVPAAKALCPAEDGTFDISPDITGKVQDATDNCTATEQLTISYTDGEISTLSDGKRRFIRTWTVSDLCGNDSVQTQTITINPLVELSVAPTTQLIALYDTITYVNVTNAYSTLNTPIVTLNNVPITLTAAGLEFQIFAQGAKLSGTPTDTGTYRILFKAISDQEPSCNSKEQGISIIVREVQDTVTVTSNSANKFYDGTPLSSHQYVVTLGHDTIPADEGSNGLIFTLHFNDKLVITPDEESEITDAGSIDNVFSCTLDHAEHYKGLVLKYGTLTVQKKTLSMWLDTSAVYTGHPFVVTYDQIHFSGLAEDDTVNAGTITTLGYAPGNYVCTSGNFYAMMEDGIAVPSGFVITNGLGNYAPAFDITLHIDGITEGFDCPDDLHIVLREGIPDTMLVLTDSATLTPMVDRIVISNDLESQNPLSAGTHTITWTLSDDLGHAMTTCEQTVIVEYTPCTGVEYQGHNYEAERIGHQCWMKENLRNTLNSNDEEIATYHLYKDNDENLDKFGYLYSWYSAMGIPEGDDATPLTYSIGTNGQPYVQGICPNGWAVASMEDFTTLFATVGDASLLKDAGEGYWLSDHGGVTSNSGFNARANGHYNSATQRYEDILTGCYFWIPEGNTSTGNVNSAVLQYYCSDGLFQQHPKSELQGVRCIRKVAP